jgi:hypothetical protein
LSTQQNLKLGNEVPWNVIDAKTRGEIEAYLAGRGKTRIHAGARNLSLNVSDDYGNRFLVELIQNAHDAHAHDGNRDDGEIAVVLDPKEGDFGCLYIANRGNGFTKDNLEAITNIALSSKSVNENIGNKGLGFRSVLQICHWPEIYSTLGHGGRGIFDGYCFRFANEKDIAAILSEGSQQDLANEILEQMPCWYLPIYAEERPGLVNRFAAEGFVTVVRIPLESSEAHEAVVSQIDNLLALETPLHLFLDRISRIRIEREPGKIESLERHVVSRSWPLKNGGTAQRLKVGPDEYLISTVEIDPVRFYKELNASLERKEIPETWRNWKGSAKVAVAVRLGQSVDNGRLYCFLPLGEAGVTPFSGYINANFYTKMDRRSVNDAIGLNRHFITVAAELSCYTIDFLIEQNWAEAPGAVVDLLCWTKNYACIVQEVLGASVGGIAERQLLPTLSRIGDIRWVKPTEAYIWDVESDACLSVESVTNYAEGKILVEALSSRQRQALESFFSSFGISFAPPAAVVAGWVEQIAFQMHVDKASPERWAAFYDEVERHLRHEPAVLFGKRFLLSANGDLIASVLSEGIAKRRRAADIYFPPVMTIDADTDDAEAKKLLPLEQLPAGLKQGFALLSRDVPWLNEDGGYRPARAFFLEAKLVREYDTGGVIRTLAIVTQSDASEEMKALALEWAFRLWSSGRSLSPKETRAANLWLPTRGGWLSAEYAMFGAGWEAGMKGRQLEALLKKGSSYSQDLADVQDNFLRSRTDWPVQHGAEKEWVEFLIAAGVRDCLRPIGGEIRIVRDSNPYALAYNLSCSVSALPQRVVNLWKSCLDEAARNKALYSSQPYRSELNPWRLPGQLDLEVLPFDLRRDYAVQVVRALRDLKSEHLKFRVFRPGNPKLPSQDFWPTPLFALLRESEWLPVGKAGTEIRFVRPVDAWYFDVEDDPMPPRFMELVAPIVAKALDEESLKKLRMDFKLRVLNNDCDAVPALVAYVSAADDGLTEVRDVRRFRELFGKVWIKVASSGKNCEVDSLPIMVDGQIKTLKLVTEEVENAGTDRVGYLIDDDNSAKRQLLEELGLPFFDFGNTDGEISWNYLEKIASGRFRRISRQHLEVYVDGVRFDELVAAPLLTDVFGGWIADFIVCAAEHRGGLFFTRTQNNLAKIRRAALSLRLQTAQRLQISMGGKLRDLPAALHGAVVLHKGNHTVLFAQITESIVDLNLLSRIADQLAAALQQKDLGNGLDASFLRLANLMNGGESQIPDDTDMAEALGTAVENLEHTRRYAKENLTVHIRFAVMLAACLGLDASVEQLRQLAEEDDPSEDNVHRVLQVVAEAQGSLLSILIEKLGMVSDLRALMEVFELPVKTVNQAIGQLAGEFKPISNEILHRQQLIVYLDRHSNQIIENLRNGFAAVFDRHEILSEYVRLRDAISTIEPNPDWFEVFDDLSEDLLVSHVEDWKVQQGVVVSTDDPALPPLVVCRDSNLTNLQQFWGRYGKIVSAWVRKEGGKVPETVRKAWTGMASKSEFVSEACKTGWLDFRILNDSEIAYWLEQAGIWPAGKPVSMKVIDWGMSEEDVQQAEETSSREREAERKRKQQVTFADKEYSAQSNDYHDLVVAVAAGIQGADVFKDIRSGFSPLEDVVKPVGSGGVSAGGGTRSNGKKSPDSSLSDDQKQAIGLIGELWAKEWIKRYHKQNHDIDVGDECWVSGYSNTVMGITSGNNMLGYDFVVRLKTVNYYYEVKASIADSHAFELGPTEISASQRYKADKNNKFRILYVANATDPKRAAISLLPNPFSREGQIKLKVVGRGSVTYEFSTLENG